MEKPTNKTHSKVPRIAYLFFLIVMLTSISLVSSLEFDNVREVKDTYGAAGYRDIEIVNWLGLGEVLWSGTLDKNTEVCGFNCEAIQTIVLNAKGSLVDDIIFKTKLTEDIWYEQNIRSYNLQIKTGVDSYEVEDYEYQCTKIGVYGNGSDQNICNYALVGTHLEYEDIWEDYNLGDELNEGTYVLKLTGNKKPSRTVDWIYKSQGETLSEWATWGGAASLCYQESANVSTPCGGLATGAYAETGAWADPIANAYDGDWDNTLRDNTGNPSILYINYSTPVGASSGSQIETKMGDAGTVTNSTIPTSCWNITLLRFRMEALNAITKNNMSCWSMDGSWEQVTVTQGVENKFFEEAMIWNFTSSSILLNAPDDNFTTSVAQVQFNSTANAVATTLVNMSLYHNATGVWHLNKTIDITPGGQTTNTSVINQTFNVDGKYLWNIEWCDADSDCGQEESNRSLIIDTTGPVVTVLSPSGLIDSFALGNNLSLNWTIEDLSLDSCWFEYDGINTTVTCADNNFSFTPVLGEQSLRMYANDTVGNVAFDDTSWTYAFLESNITFDSNVFETSSQEFELNLTTQLTVLSIDSFLVYNNTVIDRSEATCNAGNCTLTNVIDIPTVEGIGESQNKTFLWNITIFNGTDSINIQTSEREQNVSRIHLEPCTNPLYNITTLNFTAFDEADLTQINPYDFAGDFFTWLGSGDTRRSTNITAPNNASVALCLSPNATHFISGQVSYDQTGESNYTERNYFFQNDTINNVSQSIPLGLLKSVDSTSFILKVQDRNMLPVANVLIFIQRFYPGLSEFRTVQVARTDDNGGTVGFFKAETTDYRFILKQNGTTVLTTQSQKMVGESAPFTLTFTIGDDGGASWEGYEDVDDLTSVLSFNKSNNMVTFVYSDTSGDFTLGNLTIYRLMSNGTANFAVCSETSIQATATIFCNLTDDGSGSYSGQGVIERGDTEILKQITFRIVSAANDFTDVAGDYGLFLGWFVIFLSCFAFKFNEIAGIFMINVAVIGVNVIGLISFGPVFIASMIALSIFVAVILER